MFIPHCPPVHFRGSAHDVTWWGRGVEVTTTSGLNDYFKERLDQDVSWIPLSTTLGKIKCHEGRIIVFHPDGDLLGECKSRFEAVEFLLTLYIAQNFNK